MSRDGKGIYFVRVRRKGHPTQTATFTRFTEARTGAQLTEAAILEGRHFPAAEVQRHTIADMIDHYVRKVLLHKRPSTSYSQRYQLQWWKLQLGH